MEADVYYKKTIVFRAWKHEFKFITSQELFSSHDVDAGTQRLLRSIMEAGYTEVHTILDLGCGYGPAGLVLKTLYPLSQVQMVDRDSLAVDYSRLNTGLNQAQGVECYASLGYDDLKAGEFDMIVSNIPGKAGEPVIRHLLSEAARHLTPRGVMAVVAVAPLEPLVSQILAEMPAVEILVKRDWADHSIFHYRFTNQPTPGADSQSALQRGVYNRCNLTFHYGPLSYPMDTAYGLPDFDSLGNENDLVFSYQKKLRLKADSSTLICNPGQGHTAVMLWRLFQPRHLLLVDRDLLALRYAQHNLGINHCPAERLQLLHQTGLSLPAAVRIDFALVSLREEEGPSANLEIMRQLNASLSSDAVVIVTSGSTAVTRLADNLKKIKLYLIQARQRWRGQSLLALTRR